MPSASGATATKLGVTSGTSNPSSREALAYRRSSTRAQDTKPGEQIRKNTEAYTHSVGR